MRAERRKEAKERLSRRNEGWYAGRKEELKLVGERGERVFDMSKDEEKVS